MEDHPNSCFCHEAPSYYIVPLLIPEGLSRRLLEADAGVDSSLTFELMWAIDQGHPWQEHHDWEAVRERVRDVLTRYAAQLK